MYQINCLLSSYSSACCHLMRFVLDNRRLEICGSSFGQTFSMDFHNCCVGGNCRNHFSGDPLKNHTLSMSFVLHHSNIMYCSHWFSTKILISNILIRKTEYNAHLTVMCINCMLGTDKSCTDRSAILDIFDWLFLVTDIKLSHNSIHNKTARWKASNLQKQTILPTGMMFDDERLMGTL